MSDTVISVDAVILTSSPVVAVDVTIAQPGTGTGGGGVWGSITGTLSAQTDLASALNGKAATGHTHDFSAVYAPISTVSFPGFGTSHSTAAYGDHTHAQYATLSSPAFVGTESPALTATASSATYHAIFGDIDVAALAAVRATYPGIAFLQVVGETLLGGILSANLNASCNWSLPVSSGTLALTTDISSAVGAITLTSLGGVPTTRTIAGVDLSANRSLADLGAASATDLKLIRNIAILGL